jgi:hypothetical protein
VCQSLLCDVPDDVIPQFPESAIVFPETSFVQDVRRKFDFVSGLIQESVITEVPAMFVQIC